MAARYSATPLRTPQEIPEDFSTFQYLTAATLPPYQPLTCAARGTHLRPEPPPKHLLRGSVILSLRPARHASVSQASYLRYISISSVPTDLPSYTTPPQLFALSQAPPDSLQNTTSATPTTDSHTNTANRATPHLQAQCASKSFFTSTCVLRQQQRSSSLSFEVGRTTLLRGRS